MNSWNRVSHVDSMKRHCCFQGDSDMLRGVGALNIFDENCSIKPEEIKKPVIVESFGEEIVLSAEEIDVLTLGPKYNLYSRITEENLEVEVEEMIMKLK